MANSAAPTVDTNWDDACDHALEACGGDARDAIRSLLILVDYLEHELTAAQAAVSIGYRRGRVAKIRVSNESAATVAEDPKTLGN